MIKGILFDFNGTMFFDGPMHKKAWNTFSLKYRNKPITDDELDHMHGVKTSRFPRKPCIVRYAVMIQLPFIW